MPLLSVMTMKQKRKMDAVDDAITRLFAAVSSGQLTTVKKIVDNDISEQAFKNLSSTLLHQAANNQRYYVLQYLLDNGVYIDCVDANKTTALHVAARKGDSSSVNLLLHYGANVNAVDYDRRTPLYYAAYDGHNDCLTIILQHRQLDMSITRCGGWSALHETARFGRLESVKLLIRYGMDVMARTDDAMWTPGHMAASCGRLECLEALINGGGIDVNAGAGPDRLSTLLHEAARYGHHECVELLLQSGADPSLYDGTDLPHHLACRYDHPITLAILLSYFQQTDRCHLVDAFTNVDPKVDSMRYNNALHMASFFGRKDCLSVLLLYNAKNIPNGIGRTPEILAVIKLHIDCLKILLANLKAKINNIVPIQENQENILNPLYYLCVNSYKTSEKTIACACLLLNSGLFDINQSGHQESCLEMAVQNGAVGLVRFLLQSGANPYLCRCKDVRLSLSNNRNLQMCSDLIEDAKEEPKSLLLISRLKLREALIKSNVIGCAIQLPLHKRLIHYVYHGHYKINGLCDNDVV